MSRDLTTDRFATLTFTRKVAAPVATLFAAWTSPAARAVWALRKSRGLGRTGPEPSSQARSHWMVAECGWPGVRRRVLMSRTNSKSP